jgi:hypothetical protein
MNKTQITLTETQLELLKQVLTTLDTSTDDIVELINVESEVNVMRLGFNLGQLSVELTSAYNVLSDLLDEIDPEEDGPEEDFNFG